MLNKPLERTSPESVGIRSRDIERLIDGLSSLPEGQEAHHFLLMRHGKVAAEGSWAPYKKGMPHALCSVSKALTGTAVGFAVQEGLLHMDDRLVDLFPDKLPEELQPEMEKETVRILLEMGAGQPAGDAHGGIKGEKRIEWRAKHLQQQEEGDLAKTFFRTPIIYEPGTIFGYNGMCSYLLGLAVTRKSGLDLMEYLRPRLFEPLGMTVPFAARDKLGFCQGQSGVYLSAEELACLGLFYMQHGMWEGKQLLDAQWAEKATEKHLPTLSQVGPDWSQGYCWQFWRGTHNTFRFCGAYGQMCVCMPEEDAIFVVESGVDVDYMRNGLEAFFEAMEGCFHENALPEDPPALEHLRRRCVCLYLSQPMGGCDTMADAVSGTWQFAAPCPAETVTLTVSETADAVIALRDGRTLHLCGGFREPIEASIGKPNDAGAPDGWSMTAWWPETNILCIRARELCGHGRIDLRAAWNRGKLSLQLIRRRMWGETDETVWESI